MKQEQPQAQGVYFLFLASASSYILTCSYCPCERVYACVCVASVNTPLATLTRTCIPAKQLMQAMQAESFLGFASASASASPPFTQLGNL